MNTRRALSSCTDNPAPDYEGAVFTCIVYKIPHFFPLFSSCDHFCSLWSLCSFSSSLPPSTPPSPHAHTHTHTHTGVMHDPWCTQRHTNPAPSTKSWDALEESVSYHSTEVSTGNSDVYHWHQSNILHSTSMCQCTVVIVYYMNVIIIVIEGSSRFAWRKLLISDIIVKILHLFVTHKCTTVHGVCVLAAWCFSVLLIVFGGKIRSFYSCLIKRVVVSFSQYLSMYTTCTS